jgi:ribA/ribD-fused uncharacterized protein
MAITRFRGPHRFLSNFYGLEPGENALRIHFGGLVFPTTEHAFVAAKVPLQALRPVIQALPTPGEAKKYLERHGLTARVDWLEVRLAVMNDLVRQKFLDHPRMSALLLTTGDEELIEGNDWGDVFWGVDFRTGEGQNHLGRILMAVRNELG